MILFIRVAATLQSVLASYIRLDCLSRPFIFLCFLVSFDFTWVNAAALADFFLSLFGMIRGAGFVVYQ